MLIVSEKLGPFENLMILKSYESTSCDLLRLWYTRGVRVCILFTNNSKLIETYSHSLTPSYGFGGLSDSQRNIEVL